MEEFTRLWTYDEAKEEQNNRRLKFFEKRKNNLIKVVEEIKKFGEDFGVDLQEDKTILYRLRSNYNLLPD